MTEETTCPMDAEIEALQAAYTALAQLDHVGRRRALIWMQDKFRHDAAGDTEQAPRPSSSPGGGVPLGRDADR